ncbi:MAG: hypothetical protein AAB492_03355 [Patescibacteria group bacterium]
MKHSSPLVIIIPLIVAGIVIGLVFLMRVTSKASEPVRYKTATTVPALQDETGKPTNGFFVTTGVLSPVSDLEADVNGVAPINETSEIDTLGNEASAL